ncbi:MAG: polysaccharide biosynthesis/export family protein [Prosthecobacter sp.]|uniref:polysaccharide biosynthesis/export family protein n=1 Tax=Prosthecobacter sp. TaxID=1965333 RepID=UPI0038FEB5EB
MKKFLFLFLLFSSAPWRLTAQEPGFRIAESSSTSRQAAQTGEVNKGAAVLTSMDVLDDKQPISPGDKVSVRILEDRREALQQRVAVTGEIQAPYVGLITARGKTCRQLANDIKKELEKNFFKNATVVIAIDEFNPENMKKWGEEDLEFYVMFGFVAKQGKYDLPSNEDITISQAVLRAGGFAQFAKKEKVKIIRKTPQGNKTILVNVDGIMQKGDMERDIYIRKDDVIIVDELNWNF